MTTPTLRPAPIHVGDDVLEDLRTRLRGTRWPEPLPRGAVGGRASTSTRRASCAACGPTISTGVRRRRGSTVSTRGYARVDGVDLHVWQVASETGAGLPLLLLHGWPGSVVEFRHVIEPLTTGSPSFELVIPSLPGFGFGGKPASRGWGVTRCAEAFHTLMTEVLGHERYGVQGGDWGRSSAPDSLSCIPSPWSAFTRTTR